MRSRTVVLGVCGGIAAYKAASLLRLFTEAGDQVRVVPTAAALHFVGETTWAALSGRPVATDVWADAWDIPHVRLGRQADLVVVAPATADLLARAAHGLADDLLTNVLLTATCPVLMAPAMHTEMWEHPATQANVAVLRSRGITVLEPAVGRLAGHDTGAGRLPEPDQIFAAAIAATAAAKATGPFTAMAGRRVVVSAGGTREPLDPVRFLGNASSGRQGIALAEAARDAGADVVLVAGHVEVPLPDGVEIHRIGTADQLLTVMRTVAAGSDAVVMAAAVADFKPAAIQPNKIKKGVGDPEPLVLTRTVDILAYLSRQRPGDAVIVGFAAETGDATGDVEHHARHKLLAKGCDLLVVNDVRDGAVFGATHNSVLILGRSTHAPDGAAHADGTARADVVARVSERSKYDVAVAVWQAVAAAWDRRPVAYADPTHT